MLRNLLNYGIVLQYLIAKVRKNTMHKVQAKKLVSPENGMNIYRGCSHGCIYCDSRSLCYKMEHAFEDIEVKENAPQLLEERLKKKRKKCMIGTGSMSDPYLPMEKYLKLTRRCLEIIERYGYGLCVQTKRGGMNTLQFPTTF